MKKSEKVYDEKIVQQRLKKSLDLLLSIDPKKLDKLKWPEGVPERHGRLKEGVK